MKVLAITTVDNSQDDTGDYARVTFLHMGEVIEVTAEQDQDSLIYDEPSIYIDDKEMSHNVSEKRRREIFALANQIWKAREQ